MGLTASLSSRASAGAFCLAVSGLGVAAPATAQTLQSIQTPAKPLVLKARGSFFVGGRSVEQKASEILLGPDDSVTVDQMYVEYMVPAGKAKVPVVMIHGAGLSGKSYDTTPDGRMGWFEYFVRKAHPTYVVDQVGRARSGFNQAAINNRLSGASNAPSAPVVPTAPGAPAAIGQGAFRFGDRVGVWTNFRFGPRFGEAFPGERFPVEVVGEFSKQAIPDLTSQVQSPNPTLKALADLAVDLNGAVLISHSQSGPFPMDAALIDPRGVAGIVAVEPGACRASYTDEQIARLAKIPTLVVFGDNLSAQTGLGSLTWQNRLDGCRAYATRIKAAGGQVDIVATAEQGIRGNSHMLMLDRNNLQIADIILQWIDGPRARLAQGLAASPGTGAVDGADGDPAVKR
jgi:pimeloyl-ACP methyl ester carboxylesterase